MSSSSVLIIADNVNILVDTGCFHERNALIEALAANGLTCDDIHIVANTHFHMDHCWNNGLFPEARLYCSELEFEGVARIVSALNADKVDLQSIVADYLSLNGGLPRTLFDRVSRFLTEDGVFEKLLLMKRARRDAIERLGVRVIETPGHTEGHVSYLFKDPLTEMNYIITGDVILSEASLKHTGMRTLFTRNDTLANQARQRLMSFKGLFFPGHGPEFLVPAAGWIQPAGSSGPG